MERFTAEFAEHGFRSTAFFTCYGLAEAALLISGGLKEAAPQVVCVSATELEQGRASPPNVGEVERRIVSCGLVCFGQVVQIVDPQSRLPVPDGQVGEIWVQGESVANGYWDRPDETTETFFAQLADTNDGPYLRTGDLGFLQNGELYVTGRIKDVIIVRGRNHFPTRFAVVRTLLFALLALTTFPSLQSRQPLTWLKVVTALQRESAATAEAAQAVQGYYQELTNTRVMAGDWLARLERQPRQKQLLYYPDMSQAADELLEREHMPGGPGADVSQDRHGLRPSYHHQ